MNENENIHGDETAGPGRFDASRAARLREEALNGFRNQMIRLERRLALGLLMGIGIMVVGVVQLTRYQEVRGMIFAALLVLMGFETTVLLKLWYWIVNNKTGVLQEIKLLRIDLGCAGVTPMEPEGVTLAQGFKTLPGWERRFWLLAIMLLAGGSFGFLTVHVEREQQRSIRHESSGIMFSERAVTLDAVGHGAMMTTYTLMNTTARTLKSYTIYSGGTIAKGYALAPSDSPVSDGLGRGLAIQVNPAGANHQSVIQLAEPVAPGERFTLVWRQPANAIRQGGIWKFEMEQNWGYKENHYLDRVTLPPGAHLLSSTPESVRIEDRGGRKVLTLMQTLGTDGRWEYTIQYTTTESGR